jgi:hypothetical protein
MARHTSRRRFFQFLGWAAAVPVGASSFVTQATARAVAPPPLAATNLVSAVGNRESAAVIGRTFLRTCPAEADANRLERFLLARAADRRFYPDGDRPDDVRRCLSMMFRDDFATGNIVYVDGWILARSEARLYALCALDLPVRG